MSLNLNNNAKFELAKTFTELAIQNNLFLKSDDSAIVAEDIVTFFNVIFDTIDKPEETN